MSIFGIVKTVLAGDYATGKTTLRKSFMGISLDKGYLSTLGVNFTTYKHVDEDMTITFQIWDLGGQPNYKKVRERYYVGAEGCLLVFDKSRKETFDHLTLWLSEIEENITKPIIVIIIGNKEDLLSSEENKTIDKMVIEFIKDYRSEYFKRSILLSEYFSTCAIKGINVKKAFLQRTYQVE